METLKNLRKFTYVVILAMICTFSSQATHIRAGEFSARRLSSTTLEYEITLVLYYNSLSAAAIPPYGDDVLVEFGDGESARVYRSAPIDVGNNTSKNVFVTKHLYGGLGKYIVRMSEANRNGNIVNIPNSAYVRFYVEMQIWINSSFGLNDSPVMTVPPIDFGNVNKIYTHNPGAYDPDGDSLSYELIPAQSNIGSQIAGYNYPGSPVFGGQSTLGGPAFLTLNASTGDIVWNTPSDAGAVPRYYNLAIKITEWRYGTAIGYIVRDMQIEIKQEDNFPPVLAMPKDTCIEAGKLLLSTVSASDPDGNRVKLEAYGQTFELSAPSVKSTFPTIGPVINPTGQYTWQTRCSDVRRQPYQVIFKASDQDATLILTDVRTWLIYVKGPKITGVTATPGFDFVTLNWSPYTCSADATKINIYRKDCDPAVPVSDPCTTGPLAGYVLVGNAKGTDITFTDTNKGTGLSKGKSYCYILVAEYPAPAYGESYPSDQVCAQLNRDVPVFSQMDVTVTSATAGEVFLKWYKPSAASVPGSYTYDVERGVGLNPTTFTTIAAGISDTVYTDTNIDTKNTIYSYRIKLLNNNLKTTYVPLFDLTAVAGNAQATLNWTYKTPWTTDSVQIYRKINVAGTFTKLITLPSSAVTYTDTDVTNCDTVYYYLHQYGSYCDDALKAIATQISAIDSVLPLDDNPPPAPALSVVGCNGDITVFQNVLNWTNLSNPQCDIIDHYNIYFATHNTDELGLLRTIPTGTTTYTHINMQTTAGCYQVSATNVAGVEGARSDKICVDDCVDYRLPNLLTINNDGFNDLMRPFDVPQGAPRGAELVRFSVYNCWGALVFFKDTDPNIMWNGSLNGAPLSDGIYYYNAEVHFYGRVNKDDEVKNLKGWVQLLTTK
jgi:hypothetical protein